MLDKIKQFVKESFEKFSPRENFAHFERTVFWLLQLKPDADEAMQIAAYAHDIARAFRQETTEDVFQGKDWNDPEYLEIHQNAGAEIVKKFLEENGYPNDKIGRIAQMISRHEVGGDEESDLVMDADSISYLEVNAARHIQKLSASLGKNKVKEKIDWMFERIATEEARKIAEPFYKSALQLFEDEWRNKVHEEYDSFVFEKIKTLLDSHAIEYKLLHHEPTKTSKESAEARGEDLSVGGKGLVLKVNGSFKLFVLSAAKKLDSNAIEKYFHAKGIRFATAEELMQLTGLVPGSVPPFGRPILDLELYVDNSILCNKRIAFNAGSLTDSIIMSTEDYLKLVSPEIFDFSKD